MRIITAFLSAVTAVLMTSDMIHGSAMRHWRDHEALIGMNLLRTAEYVNPLSIAIRLDQTESLFTGYKQTKDPKLLHEAVLISRRITKDYPGAVQIRSLYAISLVMEATHGGSGYPLREAINAVDTDPLSVTNIENAMFLMAFKRRDYELYKSLGVIRGRLISRGLLMRCRLCGKNWLDHKEKL